MLALSPQLPAHADNSRVAEAVAEPGEGRGVVGGMGRAPCTDRCSVIVSRSSPRIMGWAGVVVIGAIRDVEVIDGIDIGVQALGVCPVKTDKQGVGDRDIPLLLREVPVAPGDWLYADRNGALVSSEPIHS